MQLTDDAFVLALFELIEEMTQTDEKIAEILEGAHDAIGEGRNAYRIAHILLQNARLLREHTRARRERFLTMRKRIEDFPRDSDFEAVEAKEGEPGSTITRIDDDPRR